MVLCQIELKKWRSRLHFEPFLPSERFQKRQKEKCSKILDPGGVEPGQSKKSSTKQASWTKKLGSGKELDLGLTGTALKLFFSICAKVRNTVSYSVFTNVDLRKNISQRCKNCVNIDVFWGVVRKMLKISCFCSRKPRKHRGSKPSATVGIYTWFPGVKAQNNCANIVALEHF